MSRYATYTLRRSTRRTVYAIYDELAVAPLCRRDLSPYTTTDRQKADRLAARLNGARDSASAAGALIDFGATQSDAWRYAQTTFGVERAAS